MTPETLLADLVEYSIDNPGKVGTAAGTLATIGAHYKKTGRVPIGRVPFRALQDAWGELADQWFGTRRPRGVPALLVNNTDVAHLETEFRQSAHFEGSDDTSFEYEDEVLNLRRPAGLWTHPDTGERIPTELHLRVFQTKAGSLLVLAHHEASRLESWGNHIRESMLSWDRGRARTARILDDLDFPYEEIESEQAADITVEPPQK